MLLISARFNYTLFQIWAIALSLLRKVRTRVNHSTKDEGVVTMIWGIAIIGSYRHVMVGVAKAEPDRPQIMGPRAGLNFTHPTAPLLLIISKKTLTTSGSN